MAKQPQGPETQEPNLVLPLASSYQGRNIDGFSEVITNSIDQRKVNCIYEPVMNSLGGNVTLYVDKRPGVVDSGSTYGTSGQTAYLHEVAPGALTSLAANRWVFSKTSNNIDASSSSLTQTVFTAAGYEPVYVDKAIFNGSDTLILQARNSSGTQRAFYSTAIGTWTEISDSDFTSLAHRGKMIFEPGRGHIMSGNRIYSCDLEALGTWSATTFLTKQITQDIGTGLAQIGKLIIGFGEKTFEVFHNIGNPTGSPLEALPDKFQRHGLASTIVTGQRHYTATVGNHLFWVGNSPRGLFAYNGETVEKVSTIGIDKILSEQQYYYVNTISFGGQIAVAIGLSLPADTTQRALLFFPEWKDWFEWNSTVFTPVTSPRLSTVFLGVDQNMHKLYAVSETSDNYQDAGTDYTMTLQFKLPSQGNQIKRMSMCGIIGDTARSSSSLNVSWSNDDYQTFSTARAIDMTKSTKMLRTCGSFRERVMKLEHTGNMGCRLDKFIARVD